MTISTHLAESESTADTPPGLSPLAYTGLASPQLSLVPPIPTEKIWFWHPSSNYRGQRHRSTICAQRVDEGRDGLVYGLAICGEGDNFSRKIGRAIARGRMLKHRCTTEAPIDPGSPSAPALIVLDALRWGYFSLIIPTWLKEWAQEVALAL